MTPDAETRSALVQLCGDAYATGPVCCDMSQVSIMLVKVVKGLANGGLLGGEFEE